MKIILRLILSSIFHCFLISTSISANNNWETIKLAYDFNFKGVGGIEKLMSPKGEKIITQVNSFIADEKNSSLLDSSEGKALLRNHQKYTNFLSAKKELERCENDKNSKRKLEGAILTGLLDTNPTYTPCKREVLQTFKSIFELSKDVNNVNQDLLRETFLDKLNLNSTTNTLRAFIKNKFRYNKDFLQPGNELKDLKSIIKKFCKGELYCSSEKRKILTNVFYDELKIQRTSGKKVSIYEATKNVNEKINTLNKKLQQVKIKRDQGVLSDHINNGVHFVIPYISDTAAPDLENQETQSQFKEYLSEYIQTTSSEDGILMHTESIRDEMGNLRTINNDENIDEDTHFASSTYQFEEHENIDEDDIKDSINDMFTGIDNQISKLQKLHLGRQNLKKAYLSTKNSTQLKGLKKQERVSKIKGIYDKKNSKNIDFLVKTNPKAVSQILVKNPEYAGLVCSSLLSLDEQDKNATGNGDLFIWGGVALGVLGFVTGGATWLLGGALAAGTAVTLGTVTTGLIVASTASSVVGGTIAYNESRVLNNEAKSIEAGILSGSSYTTSSEKMRDSYLAYKDALFDVTTSAALSLTGMGALGTLNKFGKAGGKVIKNKNGELEPLKITDKVVDNLTSFYNKIKNSATASKLLENTVKKLGPNGQKMLDEFMAQVAYLPEASRQKLLAGLLNLSPHSPKLVSLIKKAQCKK